MLENIIERKRAKLLEENATTWRMTCTMAAQVAASTHQHYKPVVNNHLTAPGNGHA